MYIHVYTCRLLPLDKLIGDVGVVKEEKDGLGMCVCMCVCVCMYVCVWIWDNFHLCMYYACSAIFECIFNLLVYVLLIRVCVCVCVCVCIGGLKLPAEINLSATRLSPHAIYLLDNGPSLALSLSLSLSLAVFLSFFLFAFFLSLYFFTTTHTHNKPRICMYVHACIRQVWYFTFG